MSITKLYKLSNSANVILDSNKIAHVYNSFWVDEFQKMIITSDTITITKLQDSKLNAIGTESTNEFFRIEGEEILIAQET